MAWAATALMVGGTAASVGGGFLSRQDAADNAAAQARARNESLKKNIGILEGYGAQNQTTQNANLAKYDPAAQAAQLATAQDTRGNANAANITKDTGADVPIAGDAANPASRSDLAKRMLAVYDGATARAKAAGKLGGYSDAWTTNAINNAQTNRDIGVTNNYAEGRKAMVQPEGDLAAAAAYKPPSIWGSVLSGVGGIASAAGGAKFGGFGGAGSAAPLPGGLPLGQGGIGHA